MLNGDQLTDIDLTAQLRQHERTGARATLALIAVEDPSAYGLVRRRDDLSVSGFLEKPNADEIDTNLVNAGRLRARAARCSARWPPAGTRISIERDVFPRARRPWPVRLRGVRLLDGHRHPASAICRRPTTSSTGEIITEIGPALAAAGGVSGRRRSGRRDGPGRRSVHAPAVIGPGCTIAAGATIAGRTVLGAGVTLGPGAHVDSSVLLDGVRIGAGSRISRSIVGPGADDRRPLPHRRRGGARRGRQGRVTQHAHGRYPYLPGCGASRRGGRVLTATTRAG